MQGINWQDVEGRPAYRNLKPGQQQQVRNKWYADNVEAHPDYGHLKPENQQKLRASFFPQEAAPAPSPADEVTLSDYGHALGTGLDRFGQLLGRGLDVIGFDETGQAIEERYKKREAEQRAAQSEAWKAEQRKTFLSDKEGEIFGDAWGSAPKVLGTILESAPSMAVGMGTGLGITGSLAKLGMSGTMAGVIGSAIGEGAMGGAEASKQAYDTVIKAPDEQLVKSSEYRDAILNTDANLPPEEQHRQAKEQLARDAALKVGGLVGTGTALLGAPSGGALGKIVGGETGKSLLSTLVKQGALEAMQEAPQSALETYQQNKIERSFVDPEKGEWEGVGESAVAGAVAGAVMGGALGGVAHSGAQTAEAVAEQPATGDPAEIVTETEAGPEKEAEAARIAEISEARNRDTAFRRNLAEADRSAIEEQVRGLGSAEAVAEKYAGDTDADKFARNYARLLDADPKTGGWQAAEQPEPLREIPQERKGATGKAYTPQNQAVDFEYAVMDAGELITSHDDQLRTNPDYPQELQPRDRGRAGMQVQINNISNNIIPEKLGDSADVGSGAPIIGDDLLVESGNGRSVALRKAYQSGKAENYRQYLTENADKFGLTPEQVQGLEKPVLVRVRKSNVGRTDFVKQANQSEVAGMSPTEQAQADAERLAPEDIEILTPDETGRLTAASNDAFIGRFLEKLGTNESAGLLSADGKLTKSGYDRVQSAIFNKAYNDSFLTELQTEQATPDIKNILSALTVASPEFAKARGLDPDMGGLDIAQDIVDGAKILRQSRSEGTDVAGLLNQQGLFESRRPETEIMARFMDENIKSGKRMGIAFKKMAELIRQDLINRNQPSLFGDQETISPAEAIEKGIEYAAETDGPYPNRELGENAGVDATGDRGGERGGERRAAPQYAEPGTDTAGGGITEADVRAAFPKQKIEQNPDGSWAVHIGENAAPLNVRAVEHIDIDNFSFRLGYGRDLTAEEAARGAAGEYQGGEIRISRHGDRYTLNHESFHHLVAHGLITDGDYRALRRAVSPIGRATEEDIAAYVEAKLAQRDSWKNNAVGRVLQKIADFVDALVNLATRTGRGVLRDFESGAIFEKAGEKADARAEAKAAWESEWGEAPQTWAEQYRFPDDDPRYSVPDAVREKFSRTEDKKTLRARLSEAFTDFQENFSTRMFDRLAPIQQTGEKAYVLHRMAQGVPAVLESFFEHGKLRWDSSGAVTTDTQKQGFLPWMESLGEDAEKLFYWMASKRAERLEKEGREKWLDGKARADIEAWVGQKPQGAESWEALNAQFQEFNQSVLDFAQEAGLIKKGQWANEDIYVPFYRVFEDAASREEFLRGPKAGNGKYLDAQIKHLQGGEAKIGDPVENILKNWQHLISESVKNKARAESYENAAAHNTLSQITDEAGNRLPLVKEIGAHEILKFQKSKDGATIITKGHDENVLSYNKDGKRKYFKVNDPELYAALEGTQAKGMDHAIMKLFRTSKRALTFGATFGPAFKVANLMRDAVHTAVISKNFNPFLDTFRGMCGVLRQDEDYVRFMASGGTFGSDYMQADDPAAMSRYMDRIIKKEGQTAGNRVLNSAKKIYGLWELFGEVSEQSVRLGLYKKNRAKNMDLLGASFSSRDLLDFSMQGNDGAVQYLCAAVPFLNARMQGIYKIGKAAKVNPKDFALKGGLITLASLALWASNRDDDRYKALEDWDRRSYYHFWIGEDHFRLPKPFEVGAVFSTIFEASADTMYGNEDLGYLAHTITETALETFALNPIPQAMRPALENYTNRSFFTGRALEGPSLQRLQAGQRATATTTDTARLVGAATGLSPVKLENIVNGYFSTIGGIVLSMSDFVIRNASDMPARPAKGPENYPLISRFYKGKTARSTKYNTRFYEIFKEVNELQATIKEYQKTGNFKAAQELARNGAGKLRFRKAFSQAQRRMADISRRMKKIRYSRALTPAQKKARMDRLIVQRGRVSERAYKLYMGK